MVTSIESPSSLEPERPTTVPAHFPATIWKLVMGTVVAGGCGGAEVQPAIVTATTTIRRPSMRIEALLASAVRFRGRIGRVKYWRAREGIESPTLGAQKADALSNPVTGASPDYRHSEETRQLSNAPHRLCEHGP